VSYILINKLKWELKSVPLEKLLNPKTDLRYVRSPSFKARVRSSLLNLGIIEPLKTRALGNGYYELLDGITRREDLTSLGFKGAVPCLVTECNDDDALTYQCVYAFTRKILDPMGLARYIKLMHDRGLTLARIGKNFNMKKAQVSKYLALNKLLPEDKLRVANRELSIDDAYYMVRKHRMPPSWLQERIPKPKPCPFCGERVEETFMSKTLLCPACVERLQEAITRERKYTQKRF
jgi:ParB-like chromosome segregation protein Spo0J